MSVCMYSTKIWHFESKDAMAVGIFRLLFSLLALSIMFPIALAGNSKYLILSISIFAFGKVTEDVSGLIRRRGLVRLFFGVGCFFGFAVLMMCFMYLANLLNIVSMGENMKEMALIWEALFNSSEYPLWVLIGLSFVVMVDVIVCLESIWQNIMMEKAVKGAIP